MVTSCSDLQGFSECFFDGLREFKELVPQSDPFPHYFLFEYLRSIFGASNCFLCLSVWILSVYG
jgi:hypothetical protein